MKRIARGLPIAAHLGLLVALAFASAFAVMLAVVALLPPRPPDVSRGDILMEQFALGYGEAAAGRQPTPVSGAAWGISSHPPREGKDEILAPLHAGLAHRLELRPDAVRFAARAARTDVFVFRVRETDERVREVLERVEERREQIIVHRRDGEGEVQIGHAPGRQMEVHVGRWEQEAPAAPAAPPAPVITLAPHAPAPPLFAPPPAGVMLVSGYSIAAQLPDARWLSMTQGQNWQQWSWIGRAALVIGATLTVLSLLALFFARRLAKPIQHFAHAVEAVGVDPQSAPVVEEGPAELRGAARAINTMQARLRALIADRTKTLAAVAHDMRTPLMRLRLAAENAAPESRERMAKEIGEVEALVASFIAFARDDPAEEARVRLDLSALLQSIADDHAEAGHAVAFEGDERAIITGQSLGLKRLFSNLIDNALKYGARARVRLSRGPGVVFIDVHDDGPGVPEAERERVFEPFVRLGVRLGAAEGGAGLGLPAARSIARAHGGDIAFLDADKGALARVTLPA